LGCFCSVLPKSCPNPQITRHGGFFHAPRPYLLETDKGRSCRLSVEKFNGFPAPHAQENLFQMNRSVVCCSSFSLCSIRNIADQNIGFTGIVTICQADPESYSTVVFLIPRRGPDRSQTLLLKDGFHPRRSGW
jgi:hypothetical protein